MSYRLGSYPLAVLPHRPIQNRPLTECYSVGRLLSIIYDAFSQVVFAPSKQRYNHLETFYLFANMPSGDLIGGVHGPTDRTLVFSLATPCPARCLGSPRGDPTLYKYGGKATRPADATAGGNRDRGVAAHPADMAIHPDKVKSSFPSKRGLASADSANRSGSAIWRWGPFQVPATKHAGQRRDCAFCGIVKG